MLNLRGLVVACIREVDGYSVKRMEEVTAYYWLFFVFFIEFLPLAALLLPLLHYFGICISLGLGLEDIHCT